eukprot:CAMPEP_0114238186 /NCGR_PEP_ID=MMETSP0058-20121206/7791_1 /TAXON_ID=36894 /ORGANISM="Pyramimonas parkeae, CCMP726" /LENGTH=146 /DNA_ID=CAMNT_0001350281 /DNA_START=384 /DNA_END=824 /DNA_ORIENTATION=+
MASIGPPSRNLCSSSIVQRACSCSSMVNVSNAGRFCTMRETSASGKHSFSHTIRNIALDASMSSISGDRSNMLAACLGGQMSTSAVVAMRRAQSCRLLPGLVWNANTAESEAKSPASVSSHPRSCQNLFTCIRSTIPYASMASLRL